MSTYRFRSKHSYTQAELLAFQLAFAAQASKYRHYKWQYAKAVVAGLIFAGVTFCVGRWLPEPFYTPVFAVLLVLLAGPHLYYLICFPVLQCPACLQTLDLDKAEDFCPECGGNQGWSTHWFSQGKRCNACGTTLQDGEERSWSVHYCTHCGVHLDVDGL
ncbi:MAG: hypothetical protein EBS05_01995 [Proteobacteria bacterium]|jgi:hypothetical protein|nr:hypothetical protein [Pseudomonadota bacterium]